MNVETFFGLKTLGRKYWANTSGFVCASRKNSHSVAIHKCYFHKAKTLTF